MASNSKNTLKIFPFYEEKIMRNSKEFSNIKLLSELPFYEKPIKAKIKQLTNEKLLTEQPFCRQPIERQKNNKLTNRELLQVLSFYDSVGIT